MPEPAGRSKKAKASKRKRRGTILFTVRSGELFALIGLLWMLSARSSLFALAALAANLAGFVLIWLDLKRTAGAGSLVAERLHDAQLSLGAENEIVLQLQSRSSAEMRAQIRDRPPVEMDPFPTPHALVFEPFERKEIRYRLMPTERGEYRFGDLWARREGRLGFIARQWPIPMEHSVKVYPNVLATRKYETLLIRGRANEIGLRIARNPGAGREFSSMRDYQPDDEFRAIDWNATARRVKLTVRQYEAERNQQVMVLLDCGRMMSASATGFADRYGADAETGGAEMRMTKLDFAVNAALAFTHVSLGLGDRAGLLAFAEETIQYLPPRQGDDQLRRILEALYNVRASAMDASYPDAFLQIERGLRKRSLLLLFTDLLDRESSRTVLRYLSLLARRHLCICIAVGDPEVVSWATKTPVDDDEVYRQAVALSALQDRAVALNELRRSGVKVADALPDGLSAEAVRRYLEAKSRGWL